ncbi:MAG TPA: NAD(P)H-dependent oxidoreductase subunit E [Methyloceanibacter sp.]|jgi:NADH:ubiquinone oxidoreductase subunit F (NADH-binding)/NADH:ubiquinone oxidoreductase subunit E|nr:NAD(P)H-dependent oxidoreductase subunit E [Methyloceanibacter sp.]
MTALSTGRTFGVDEKTRGNGGPDRPARHVGSRKKARAFPKGRQLDIEALEEIRALLGDRPRRHDLLIEYLHLIQDRYHAISAPHLKALCEELRLPQAAAYEVATFYAHFDVLKEGETPPPPTTIRVCDSITCAIKGAEALFEALKSGTDRKDVRVLYAPCMGRCDTAPVAEVGHFHVDNATPKDVMDVVTGGNREPAIPAYETLAEYRAKGGYAVLENCRAGKLSFDSIIKEMTDAGLRGLGGAGFPAGRKWQIVRSYPGPRLMTINGDEGEPGTFKDRFYLERDPHQMFEGALIAAWAVEAERIYLYMRDEYPAVLHILTHEIAALEEAGIIKKGDIELRRGAGAYICGEESAMIESIEGKRGYPRNRPPYIAELGLFGRPTLNHNVETLYWVPEILKKGAKWFADHGVNGAKGLRSWSVSGRVKKAGVILAPAGITAHELVALAGGMEEGESFKAYLPGGASGGILPASMADIPLDFGTLDRYGAFVGSHAIVVFSERDKVADVAINLLRFFKDESCGQCTPCRVGCDKAVALLERDDWDKELLTELAQTMRDASICGLGQAAPNVFISAMQFFLDEPRPTDVAGRA